MRRNWGVRDLIAYNLPMEKSIHDAWARGTLPVWTPEVSGGRPLAPNPNVGALYPVRVLLSRVPFPLAMRLFPVLHWIAAGIGMLALLLAIGRSRAAAWIGAVTYAFSGVAVAEAFFPHILPGLTLLPWILWAACGAPARRATRLLTLSALLRARLPGGGRLHDRDGDRHASLSGSRSKSQTRGRSAAGRSAWPSRSARWRRRRRSWPRRSGFR